jgi:hypothetical protein
MPQTTLDGILKGKTPRPAQRKKIGRWLAEHPTDASGTPDQAAAQKNASQTDAHKDPASWDDLSVIQQAASTPPATGGTMSSPEHQRFRVQAGLVADDCTPEEIKEGLEQLVGWWA